MSRLFGGLMAAALILGAGAVQAAPGPPPDLAAVHSLGVISQFGATVDVQYAGATIFQFKSSHMPVPEWGLDDRATAKVKSALGGRLTVTSIAAPPTLFAGLRIRASGSNARAVEQALQGLPKSNHLLRLGNDRRLADVPGPETGGGWRAADLCVHL